MKRAAFATALLLGLFFDRPAAQAIGSCVCEQPGWALPWFTREMPLNGRVFVSISDAGPFEARLTRDGLDVPVLVVPAGGRPGNLWITPTQRLAPNSKYELLVRSIRPGAAADRIAGSSFETRDEPGPGAIDEQPPQILTASTTSGGLGDHCGTATAAATISAGFNDTVGEALLQMDVDIDGKAERVFALQRSGGQVGVGIAEGGSDEVTCLGERRLLSAMSGGTYPLRLTVWDWAGNATAVEGLNVSLQSNPAPTKFPRPAPLPTTSPSA